MIPIEEQIQRVQVQTLRVAKNMSDGKISSRNIECGVRKFTWLAFGYNSLKIMKLLGENEMMVKLGIFLGSFVAQDPRRD